MLIGHCTPEYYEYVLPNQRASAARGFPGGGKVFCQMETTVPGVGDEALAEAVFEKVRPDLLKVDLAELLQVNLDLPAAISTVLGVLPELRGLRDQIAKELPTFDIQRFDKLEDYAVALSYAQAKYLAATQPPDDLADVAERAMNLREALLAECNALVLRKIVSPAQLEQLKGANGYKNVATDLMTLCTIMQDKWDQLQGKTLTTTDELNEASRVATRLLRIVGVRTQGPAVVAEATDLRQRAYTLLLQTYDDARRAVTYLRADEGDADDIAPALHPGRPRKRGDQASGPTPAPGPAPTPPGPKSPGPTSGTMPTAAAAAAAPAAPMAMASSDGTGPYTA